MDGFVKPFVTRFFDCYRVPDGKTMQFPNVMISPEPLLSQDLTIPARKLLQPTSWPPLSFRTELAAPSLLSILIPLYNEEEFIR